MVVCLWQAFMKVVCCGWLLSRRIADIYERNQPERVGILEQELYRYLMYEGVL